MAKRGQPTKLTPEVHDRIVQAVRAGSYFSHAAAYAGISRETLYEWLDRGKTERARLDADPKAKPNPDEAHYLHFSDTLIRVEGEAVIEAVASWKQAGRTDWRAAKEWLARRHGSEWGDKSRIEHSGADGAPITLAGLHALLEADDDDSTDEG